MSKQIEYTAIGLRKPGRVPNALRQEVWQSKNSNKSLYTSHRKGAKK